MDGIELSNSAIKILGMIKRMNFQNGVKGDYLFYDNEYGRLKHTFSIGHSGKSVSLNAQTKKKVCFVFIS